MFIRSFICSGPYARTTPNLSRECVLLQTLECFHSLECVLLHIAPVTTNCMPAKHVGVPCGMGFSPWRGGGGRGIKKPPPPPPPARFLFAAGFSSPEPGAVPARFPPAPPPPAPVPPRRLSRGATSARLGAAARSLCRRVQPGSTACGRASAMSTASSVAPRAAAAIGASLVTPPDRVAPGLPFEP